MAAPERVPTSKALRFTTFLAAALLAPVAAEAPPATPPALQAAPPHKEKADRIYYPAHSESEWISGGHRFPIRSLLNIRKKMRFGDFIWDEKDVPAGPSWILVDLSLQTISVFRAGHEIGSAVILYGSDGTPTPTGLFAIIERDQRHRSTLYDADMNYMLRLTMDGVAIHASSVREGYATHGCIGIPNDFAAHLFSAMRKGDVVAIRQHAASAT